MIKCTFKIRQPISFHLLLKLATHIKQLMLFYSRRAEKYFKRGVRLDWPEGATSRESMKAVWKLPRLQVLHPLMLFICSLSQFFFAQLTYDGVPLENL